MREPSPHVAFAPHVVHPMTPPHFFLQHLGPNLFGTSHAPSGVGAGFSLEHSGIGEPSPQVASVPHCVQPMACPHVFLQHTGPKLFGTLHKPFGTVHSGMREPSPHVAFAPHVVHPLAPSHFFLQHLGPNLFGTLHAPSGFEARCSLAIMDGTRRFCRKREVFEASALAYTHRQLRTNARSGIASNSAVQTLKLNELIYS